MNATRPLNAPQFRRLPRVPRARSEALVHLALAVAALSAVWQFQSAIVHFVPRAAAFAARVRETPTTLVDRSYAVRAPRTNTPDQASAQPATNAPARPAIGPARSAI